ncbi:hypothetical protein EC988_009650, partial [Linderina pennispora]
MSASSFIGSQRNYLFDSFAPSVFSRPLGPMTPTDQLDALALEGRMGSGYSTPTHSTRRRHSIQTDIQHAMAAAAAAAAAGMDRSNFASALQFLDSSGAAESNVVAGSDSSVAYLSPPTAETIRRMTVGADAMSFPRLPDEEAVVGLSAQVEAVNRNASVGRGAVDATSRSRQTADRPASGMATGSSSVEPLLTVKQDGTSRSETGTRASS